MLLQLSLSLLIVVIWLVKQNVQQQWQRWHDGLDDASDLPERLDNVLRVVYLVYNEGYSASAGESSHELPRLLIANALQHFQSPPLL